MPPLYYGELLLITAGDTAARADNTCQTRRQKENYILDHSEFYRIDIFRTMSDAEIDGLYKRLADQATAA